MNMRSGFLLGCVACTTVWALTEFDAPWYAWVIVLLVALLIGLLWLLEQSLPRWPGW